MRETEVVKNKNMKEETSGRRKLKHIKGDLG
jgi:hypothetical protein